MFGVEWMVLCCSEAATVIDEKECNKVASFDNSILKGVLSRGERTKDT